MGEVNQNGKLCQYLRVCFFLFGFYGEVWNLIVLKSLIIALSYYSK